MSPQPTAIRLKPAPSIGVERVRAYIRSRFNPIRSLTPELLSQYLDAFKTGHLRQCALVWDAIEERDDVLSGVIAKRKAAAARHGWEILTLDSIPEGAEAEAAGHKQALETFYNNLTVVNAIDANERGEVSLLLRQMMDAVGKRYAVHEIVWKPVRGSGRGRDVEGLTAELRFAPLWFFEKLTGRLRYLASENALEGVEMDEAAWLVSVGPGLMAACAVAYIYKSLSLKDWVLYNERHGMPGIHGKTDAPKDSDEWEDMVEAVRNFAADWSMVTSSDASIEKVDMAAVGTLPFPPLVERMDRAMAALWRGADLSTMSAGAGDAGQGASLQGRESEILEQDDAQWLSETLSRQLDRRVIEYVFGPGVKPLAYIKIKTAQKQDVAQELLVDAFLRDSGAPLSVKNALERYRRPVPDANDDLLTPPVSSAGAGIPPFGSISPAPSRPAPFGAFPPASANSLANAAVGSGGPPDRSSSVSEAVAETLAIRSAWLEPFFAGLEAKARDGTLTDAQLLAAVEQAARALPDLVGDRPVQEIAGVIWKTLAAAAARAALEPTTERTP
jgi:phage gp29-like protein